MTHSEMSQTTPQEEEEEQGVILANAAALLSNNALPSSTTRALPDHNIDTAAATYTIVQDLNETMVDWEARYDDDNETAALAVTAVPVTAAGATTTAADTISMPHQHDDYNSYNHGYPSVAAAAAAYSPYEEYDDDDEEEEYKEEAKEEITGLAGLPTAGVANYAEPATVIRNGNDDDDDEELACLKRAAYNGTESMVPDREPQPEPLPLEDFAEFYARTIDHWNVWAAERLTGSGVDLTLDTLEDESTRMASQRWQEMQPDMNAQATVVAIAERYGHSADLGAVQAEWVRFGQEGQEQGQEQQENFGTTAVAIEDNIATEATVIDTAPISKEEGREAWQAAEEAQVLENVVQTEAQEEQEEEERKPPANSSTNSSGQHVAQVAQQAYSRDAMQQNTANTPAQYSDEYAVADQEGVVLAIEDDVHPADFTRDDADAQVVGADYAYAYSNEDGSTTPTVSAVDNNDESVSAEVQAVLVEGDGSATASFGAVTATPAVADSTMEESQTVSVLPAESITVGQDDLELPSTTKEVPWSGPPRLTSTGSRQKSTGSRQRSTGSRNSRRDEDDDAQDEFDDGFAPPPPRPRRESFGNAGTEQSETSGNSEKSTCSQKNQLQNLSSNIARSTGNVMDALFGDTKGPFVGRKSRASENDIAGSVIPRTLLPWSVIFSPANKMWVATIQTSQKALDSNDITEASKALRAFSLPTEKQAISLARAWTPPRMLEFKDNPSCHICKSKFAVFRRACHCRNCGVCICKECTIQWPSNMVPETYNKKDEVCMNACKSCDWISNAFRLALLKGNMDEAIAIHATGNINVTCPFSNIKGELFYPVHCAVLGGNLQLLRWLVDEQCCPIKSVRVSGRSRESAGRYTPIVTSKGRSLLGIAMENCFTSIVRYLVVKKGIVIAGERDITHEMLTKNLTKILRSLPDESCSPDETDEMLSHEAAEFAAAGPPDELPAIPDPQGNIRSLSDGARDFGAIYQHRDSQSFAAGQVADECIICFDGKIDCVATPCGHQICCLKCSKNVSRCPVCAQDCSFMRVFKP